MIKIKKPWSGRFTADTDQQVELFTQSISFDYQLAIEDILGSLAHVKMLGKCKILSEEETQKISDGLKKIAEKIKKNEIEFDVAHEDIHMNVEYSLSKEIGDIAGKLHTARSRNDQVATDLRLYLRSHSLQVIEELLQLLKVLLEKAQTHCDVIMPGYTHLQRAQPILFSHHLMAYAAMLSRDIQRLRQSWPRINLLPLGAGALAGTSFPINRYYTAALLGFDGVCENSVDAVSDRDYVIEFLSHAALIMMHLSRFSEELILWSSQEFGFIELGDAYCTGSSMMPQKKNPDVPELMRGKTARVYGALLQLLTLMKGLPLAYNKDMQEDKEPLFDTIETLHAVLKISAPLVETMQVKSQAMRQAAEDGFMNATDMADYLAKKAIPFRKAHEITGKIVQFCLEKQKNIHELSLAEFHQFSSLIEEDIYLVLDIGHNVESRNSAGGTAKQQVILQIQHHQDEIKKIEQWLFEKEQMLKKVHELFL